MKLQNVIISFIAYVHLSESNNSAPTQQIFTKIKILQFFKNLSRNPKFL